MLDVIALIVFAAGIAEARNLTWAAFPLALAAAVWPFPIPIAAHWAGKLTQSQATSGALRLGIGAGVLSLVGAYATSQGDDFGWASVILAASGMIHLLLDGRIGEPAHWVRHVLAFCLGVAGAAFGLALDGTLAVNWAALSLGFYGFAVSFATRHPIALADQAYEPPPAGTEST